MAVSITMRGKVVPFRKIIDVDTLTHTHTHHTHTHTHTHTKAGFM